MTTATPEPHRDVTRITLTVLGIGVLIAGSLLVLRPFLGPLLWATTIVVATWPIMRKVEAGLGGRRGPAVAVMTIALLLAVFVPLYLAVAAILEQTDQVTEFVRTLPTFRLPPPPPWLDALPLVGKKVQAQWLELAALEPSELAARLTPYVGTALGWFASQAGTFGGMLIHFLITAIIAAILYVKGEGAVERVRRFFRRLGGERGDAIVTLSGQSIRAVALGIVVTAAVQGVVTAIGLYAIGLPIAGFLTAVVLVFCIAQLGPFIPLVPAVVWLYASGSSGRATAILVVMLLVGAIDNFLRPVLIKRGADLSLLLILPGVIGGLLWLGIIGLFIGPVILAVATTLLDSWTTSGLGEPGAPETAAPPVTRRPADAA
jgi:predicted PurR-regulated permease PerM